LALSSGYHKETLWGIPRSSKGYSKTLNTRVETLETKVEALEGTVETLVTQMATKSETGHTHP